jgi:hypothetical protein
MGARFIKGINGSEKIKFLKSAVINNDNSALLLHMDGANGSTTFIDNSTNNLTVTAYGDAQISTTNKVFGTGSALFDGDGDYLRTELSNNNWDNDFTVEMWIYTTNVNYVDTIFEAGDIQGGQGGVHIYIASNGDEDNPQNLISFNNGIVEDIAAGSVILNQWTNIVISRSSGTNYLFQDGILIGSGVQTFTVNNNIISIGGAPGYGFWFNGYIDEVRITKGVAIYTANFTPPTAPFGNTIVKNKIRFIKPA